MPANTAPVFGVTPVVGGVGNAVLTAANTAFDGTGTVLTVYTAGANGSFVQRIRFKASGGAGNNNIQTVARVFANNGSTNTSATNNIFIDEITLPATTGVANAAVPAVDMPINFPLPNGWKLNVVLGTAVASGYYVSAYGEDY